VFSLCEYNQNGPTGFPIGLLSIFELENAQAAKHEFAVDVKLATGNGDGHRPLSGPWEAADEFGPNLVFALKGSRVSSFNFVVYEPKPVKYPQGLAQSLLAATVRRF
jgi:hypothetical protein